jgi:hypothetical protein
MGRIKRPRSPGQVIKDLPRNVHRIYERDEFIFNKIIKIVGNRRMGR